MGGGPQGAFLPPCGLLHYNDSIFGTSVTVTAVAIRYNERRIKEKTGHTKFRGHAIN